MNKYNKAMARVTVSEEMKNRILDNITSTGAKSKKIVRFGNIKRYTALAACVALVIALAFTVTLTQRTPQTGDLQQTAGPAIEYNNAKELSKASKIKIKDLENLPFDAAQISYLDYGCNLAEIYYSNGSSYLYYRASKGSEDNSGDYNEYERVETRTENGVTFTLKGNGDLVFCVLYEKNGRSYSIGSSKGLTFEQIINMIP